MEGFSEPPFHLSREILFVSRPCFCYKKVSKMKYTGKILMPQALKPAALSPKPKLAPNRWQDDGAEVAPASIHAGLHYYAEAMRGSPRIGPGRRSEVQGRAEGVFDALAAAGAGGRFRQVYEAARMDVVPGMPESWGAQNLAKWLLWEDPLHGHLSAQVSPKSNVAGTQP